MEMREHPKLARSDRVVRVTNPAHTPVLTTGNTVAHQFRKGILGFTHLVWSG
jgi:hypothetical protein